MLEKPIAVLGAGNGSHCISKAEILKLVEG